MNLVVRAISTGLRVTSVVAPPLADRWVFALFCRLRKPSPVGPAQAAMHGRAQVSHLTHDGRRVVVYRWGDGAAPVLLVHGWESRGAVWSAQAESLLAAGFSPVTFDAPGNGDSEGTGTTLLEYADVIEELHRRHGPFRGIVAHSFGSLAAFMALRRGVAADRLVTISGVCDFEYLVEAFSGTLRLTPRLRRGLTRRFEALFPDEPDVARRFSAPYDAESLTMPLLVIHDEGDRRVPVAQAEGIVAAYPQAKLITRTGLGHNRILADPETVSTVTGFLG